MNVSRAARAFLGLLSSVSLSARRLGVRAYTHFSQPELRRPLLQDLIIVRQGSGRFVLMAIEKRDLRHHSVKGLLPVPKTVDLWARHLTFMSAIEVRYWLNTHLAEPSPIYPSWDWAPDRIDRWVPMPGDEIPMSA